MKTLRYLLTTCMFMTVMSMSAQGLAEQPQIGFQSTSSMVGSGSALPQAAVEGAYTTYETGTPHNSSGIRKGSWNPDPGDEPGPDEGDNNEPYKDPIGDGVIMLALCALAYLIVRTVRKRARAVSC